MLLKNREIAFSGIMMAFAVILVTLGGYLEMSTLFFLAAASFLTGVMERNFNVFTAGLFLAGAIFLSFFLAPQKFYVATFAAFGIYVLVAEFFEKKYFLQGEKVNQALEWGSKGILYHILLAISVVLTKEIFGFSQLSENKIISALQDNKILLGIAFFVAAEVFWLVFDRAYIFFMRRYGRFFFIGDR